jgi:DNA-binding response OmpR family regulator
MWILVVEDESRLADVLKRGLESAGYTVDVAGDGDAGEELALVNDYDCMVVDWRLPKQNGNEMISALRKSGVETPALLLTVLDDVEHRVAGLDAGADDYLSKPFSFDELLARIRALLRRSSSQDQSPILSFEEIQMDTRKRTVQLSGVEVLLRPKEYALLEVFLRQPEVVLSRTVIAERVWGSALYVSDNVLDVTVSGLRQKMHEHPDLKVKLETIRGIGYKLIPFPGKGT